MINMTREKRIQLRASEYAAGKIDLQTFYALEALDEMTDDEPADEAAQPTPAAPQPQAEQRPNKGKPARMNITKEEFNAMHINDQQQLYEKDPEAVKRLINDGD